MYENWLPIKCTSLFWYLPLFPNYINKNILRQKINLPKSMIAAQDCNGMTFMAIGTLTRNQLFQLQAKYSKDPPSVSSLPRFAENFLYSNVKGC